MCAFYTYKALWKTIVQCAQSVQLRSDHGKIFSEKSVFLLLNNKQKLLLFFSFSFRCFCVENPIRSLVIDLFQWNHNKTKKEKEKCTKKILPSSPHALNKVLFSVSLFIRHSHIKCAHHIFPFSFSPLLLVPLSRLPHQSLSLYT